MAEDRRKVLEAGCDAHHTKPVELTELLAQIETLLKRS
jgi:DNA-binding response OmpR family regulator